MWCCRLTDGGKFSRGKETETKKNPKAQEVESHGANGFEEVMKKFFLVSELSATTTL